MTMLQTYNPDVLTCLANLSSDEVFTPPSIANQMLDLLPAEIWRNKTATFLDPARALTSALRAVCWPLYAQEATRAALILPKTWDPQAMVFVGRASDESKGKTVKPLDEVSQKV